MPRCPRCHRRLGAGALCPRDQTRAAGASAVGGGPAPAIPDIEIGEALGGGGFASVWAGVRRGWPVAIKLAHAATELAASRFSREAEALAAVGPPAAPPLLDAGRLEGGGRPFLIMERVEGMTLARWMEATAPRPLADALRLAAAIATNLAAVHGAGWVHRDLKPENVIVAATGAQLRLPPATLPLTTLNDFGLARPSGSPGEAVIEGSVEYQAPEQLRGEASAPPADLYALGAILFELVCARPPFVGSRGDIERGHLALQPPRPGELAAVSVELEALILACLAKEPHRRPVDAAALAAAIGAVIDAPPSAAAPAPAPRLSLAQEGEPAVLVWGEGGAGHVGDAAGSAGVVARQKGEVSILFFAGGGAEEPVVAARRAADALVAAGARVCVHLDRLRIRRRRGRVQAYGAGLEQPEEWLPEGPWRGVAVTAAAAALLDSGELGADLGGGARQLVAARRDTGPLLGRDADLAALAASWRRVALTRSPELVTVLGDPGLGKSRLLAAAAEIAAGATRIDLSAGASAPPPAPGEPTALLVDDGHLLGDDVLDRLEYLSLDRPGSPLWVVVAARPALIDRRRGWGGRAGRATSIELAPLPAADSIALAAALLEPADFVPRAALERLASWSGGNPFHLVKLIGELSRQGVIRRRAGSAGWMVATEELAALPPVPARQWLATRALAELPGELAELARLCSVLAGDLGADAVAAIDDGGSGVDAGVGLRELAARGLLVEIDPSPKAHRNRGPLVGESEGRFRFAEPNLRDAVRDLVREDGRVAIHRRAYAYWKGALGPGASEAERVILAIHAAGAGAADAAALYTELGELAQEGQRWLEADERFSKALAADPDEAIELRATAGRGRGRYRMQRMLEALEDLELAAALAARLGERARVAELLLEQATVLDWMERFADSAARAAEARPIALATGDPRLRARLLLAEGRAFWRREEIGPAIEALERAVAAAAAAGDVETEIIALLLLPLPLLFAGDRDRAPTLFARGIELAESAGDRLHVCVALTNRMFLWRDDPGRAVADLRRANQLARELGQAAIERVATHNLAEILYWSGEDAEARDLAERGLELKVRFVPEPVADDGLLLARICIASGDLERAREILAALRAEVPDERLAPSDRVLLEGLERSVGVATAAPWHELRRRARADLGPEEAVEVAYLSALDACRRNDPVAAREALNEANSGEIKAWRTRLRSLEDALDHLLGQINM